METDTNNYHLQKYVDARIRSTEELIHQTRRKLNMSKPRFWKVKQMKKYYKNMKEVEEKISYVSWLVSDINYVMTGALVN